eukprot:TRINITY_DN6289_c2_g1_i1.p1 TRINITY_DN6289_c2_g1~~TRINITY_DN6289_c2_g1_i1.p1  ORF type:complete len:424 (+),score=73.06 TRINITY_DN6289_c2_g1_i1:536-1807(+)
MGLLSVLRHESQITLVLPYFKHDKFKTYMNDLSLENLRMYMFALFTALRHLHAHSIIHRDVKPSNFLYNVKKSDFLLVDFGLAEIDEITQPQQQQFHYHTHNNPTHSHSTSPITVFGGYQPGTHCSINHSTTVTSPYTTQSPTHNNNTNTTTQYTGPWGGAYPHTYSHTHTPSSLAGSPYYTGGIHEPPSQSYMPMRHVPTPVRSSIDRSLLTSSAHATTGARRAGRAGTRGFRAPEVLMKSTYQTVALDIWSAGVILLCIISGRYPFFCSPDDLTALAEISCLTGTAPLSNTAHLLNKQLIFSEERPKLDLQNMCERLTTHKYQIPVEVYDLLQRCLDVNPCTRINATEALAHPFLQPLSQAHAQQHGFTSSPQSSSSPSSSTTPALALAPLLTAIPTTTTTTTTSSTPSPTMPPASLLYPH